MKSLYFSFNGRINRADYWLGSLTLFLLPLLGGLVDYLLQQVYIFAVLGLLLSVVPSYALTIKRCHDRDRSGWFCLTALVPGLALWLLIECGFLRGTRGPNRFGAAPVVR